MKNKYNPATNDPERNPDYVYDENLSNIPDVDEMQCPEEQFLGCAIWMDRTEMLKHYKEFHAADYNTDTDAIETIFEAERIRRYER